MAKISLLISHKEKMMQLDEIKEIIYKETSLMEIEAEFLADKIFEKIEYQKCENCTYHRDYGACHAEGVGNFFPPENYGCNLFASS